MLYILKMGKTVKSVEDEFGGFDRWILKYLGTDNSNKVVDVQSEERLPELEGCTGIVVSGAHEMVTDQWEWSERTAEWLQLAVKEQIPVLGICYGHQLLAYALGGDVWNNPKGSEIATVDIRLSPSAADDSLFSDLPSEFKAHASHSQSVKTLPPGSVILAENDFDSYHAVRFAPHAWGVQFHPEFDVYLMDKIVEYQREELRDYQATKAGISDTPVSNSILAKFADLCKEKALSGSE